MVAPTDDAAVQAALDQVQALMRLARERPSLLYTPGRKFDLDGNPIDPADNGQLQFHSAPHIYRLASPGNGWGKTACAAVEVDWWGFGDHPWQDVPANRPRRMMWVAEKFQQFFMMRSKIEQWWPDCVRLSWVGAPHFRYTWPDGSTLHVITAETDWKTIQGIEPDLIMIDEECPAPLFHELQRRRRGTTRTRYCITATATQGLTWTYKELYLPWLNFHKARGLSEREAMRAQGHRYDQPDLAHVPGIWVWPYGSHQDNPTATKETWALYLTQGAGSEAEREVRLYGGYRDFAGKPVFNLDNLEAMRQHVERGRTGVLERVYRKGEPVPPPHLRPGYEKPIAEEHPAYRLNQSEQLIGGRLTIYREPLPGHTYCLGLDFAEGLEGGDQDAGIMLDEEGREVAVIVGNWGPSAFGDVLLPLVDWYRPFIVGERARGLEVLRRLYSLGHWLYFDRDEEKRGRPVTDRLGHAPKQLDPPVRRLQALLGPRDKAGRLLPARVLLRDEEHLHQMCRFQFRPRSKQVDLATARDDQLIWSAPSGEHDDLVRAGALAAIGLEWLPEYQRPKPSYRPGQLGHMLGHAEEMAPPPTPGGSALAQQRRR